MRIEGPGTATDFLPSKSESNNRAAVKEAHVEETADKVKLDNLLSHKANNMEEVQGAVDIVNKAIKISNHRLEFQLHEESGRYQVKVIDSVSEEVIKEMPPEEMLDLSVRIRETVNKVLGIMVDEFM